MCQICENAFTELKNAAAKLEEKYRGTELPHPVTGEPTPVAPVHHLFVASMTLARYYAALEAQWQQERAGNRSDASSGLSRLFGGPEKDIAA